MDVELILRFVSRYLYPLAGCCVAEHAIQLMSQWVWLEYPFTMVTVLAIIGAKNWVWHSLEIQLMRLSVI